MARARDRSRARAAAREAPEVPAAGRTGAPEPGRAWIALVWAAVCLAAAGALQAWTSVPADVDTPYHVVVGRLIRAHGLLTSFPWTPFSILADRYADKELLFHLLFVPLASVPWITAAKIVGTLCGATTLFVLYLVLRREGVRYAGLWALLPVAASGAFVFRFALVRPHVLSIGLALLALWAASRRRLAVLAIVCAVYPWAHVSWHVVLVLAVIAEVAAVLSGERPSPRPLAAGVAGLVIGVAVHPNTVNLIRFAWIQLWDVLAVNIWAGRSGFAMGNEFRPFTLVQAARFALVPAAICVAGAALAWRERKRSSVPLAFAIAALGFGLLTVRSARFVELFVPFSVAALGLSARSIRWRPLAPAVLAGSVLFTAAFGTSPIENLATRVEILPGDIAAELERRIPPDAQVFTCEWHETGELMMALPGRRFMVALDPTLFYVKDPALYELWYRLPREAPAGAADAVRRSFGARWVLCNGKWWRRFESRLAAEPGVTVPLSTPTWTLVDLGAPAGSP